MEMGYTLDIEFNRLIIHPTVILDYDRIVTCHRDCLLAQVESLVIHTTFPSASWWNVISFFVVTKQIMSEIHSALRVNLRPCSWAAIFDYRDSYVGSVPHCVRGLMYQQAQKESQQMAYACTTPAAAPTMSNPYALGPHEIYPTSYHHPYHQYHHSHHHHQQQQHQQPMRPVYAYSYQAEHQPHHRGTAMAAYLPKTLPGIEMPANAALPSLDAKSNFREEPKSRPVPEPFEVWNNNGAPVMKSVPKFDSLLDIDRLEQLCYDEVDTRQSQAETTKQAQRSPNSNKETTSNASKASTASSGTVQDKSSRATTSSTSAVKTLVKSFSATGARPKENIHPPSNGTTAKDAPDRSKVQRNGWECVFCTYLNSSGKEICDMCAKSRNRGPESQPLHRGGRECSNCTLVNPPDEEKCAACSTSLIHAPTYI